MPASSTSITHAFFKALLFLGSGSVIHAMSGEQDMRKMGGIWKQDQDHLRHDVDRHLALIGFPGFAGYFSKDAILEAAYASHNPFHLYAFWMGVLAAVLTAFYSGRLIWLTFHGEPRADHETMHHVHESPPVMTVPLMVLAAGAILAGWLGHGHGRARGRFLGRGDRLWRAQPRPARHARGAVLGEAGAVPRDGDRPGPSWVLLHAAAGPRGADRGGGRPDQPLFYNKWYFDELYDFLFVRPAKALG